MELRTLLAVLIVGWRGARCELDVDECAEGGGDCGPGRCVNLEGSYTCECSAGFCGLGCALRDPCYELAETTAASAGPGGAGTGGAGMGPCANGGRCEQNCLHVVDYTCHCTDSWGGKNCSQQIVSASAESDGGSARGIVIGVCAALVALAALAALGAALGAQARRKRATRGTYSPSGQEYCNPRAHHHPALKPPPEERLI